MSFQYSIDAFKAFNEIQAEASESIRNGKPLDEEIGHLCEVVSGYLEPDHMISLAADLTKVIWSAVQNESCPPDPEKLRSALWILSEHLEFTANSARASSDANYLATESAKLNRPKRKVGAK